MTSYLRGPFVSLTGAAALCVVAASAASAQGCGAWISSPVEGGGVPLNATVGGKLSTPGYTKVWIFTHRKGLPKWWPQGGGPVRNYFSGWQANATFGMEKEAGQIFEVAAIPVDDATNARLTQWVEDGNASGNYPGMALPPPLPGCGYSLVSVRRM